jgi:hypothetical protein
MAHESWLTVITALASRNAGVFRGRDALRNGVSRDRLTTLTRNRVVERVLPDTYRFLALPPSSRSSLVAALLWAGASAAAWGRSGAELYKLEGVRAPMPEVVVPRSVRVRSSNVLVHRSDDRAALMIRRAEGLRVTGIEATLLALAATLDDEALEIACEDARRRELTAVPALRAYLDRHGRAGRPGIANPRALLAQLDPTWPSRSTLEVKTRRLLVARGLTGFEREFPLTWNGRTYRYDFTFAPSRVILETNGKRWHNDPADFEDNQEKWSVPGRLGWRIVFATWPKVVHHPNELIAELTATLAAG